MKILFVCSQGMSSAIAAKALQDAAKKKGIDLTVDECSTQEFGDKIKDGYAMGMVAPQIRHRFDTLKEEADAADVPCVIIDRKGYSPMGGAKMLAQVEETLGKL